MRLTTSTFLASTSLLVSFVYSLPQAPQQCPPSSQWYNCPGQYVGCCTIDACSNPAGCPDQQGLIPAAVFDDAEGEKAVAVTPPPILAVRPEPADTHDVVAQPPALPQQGAGQAAAGLLAPLVPAAPAASTPAPAPAKALPAIEKPVPSASGDAANAAMGVLAPLVAPSAGSAPPAAPAAAPAAPVANLKDLPKPPTAPRDDELALNTTSPQVLAQCAPGTKGFQHFNVRFRTIGPAHQDSTTFQVSRNSSKADSPRVDQVVTFLAVPKSAQNIQLEWGVSTNPPLFITRGSAMATVLLLDSSRINTESDINEADAMRAIDLTSGFEGGRVGSAAFGGWDEAKKPQTHLITTRMLPQRDNISVQVALMDSGDVTIKQTSKDGWYLVYDC